MNHRETAIEVTISRNVREADLKGLKFFKEPIWAKGLGLAPRQIVEGWNSWINWDY